VPTVGVMVGGGGVVGEVVEGVVDRVVGGGVEGRFIPDCVRFITLEEVEESGEGGGSDGFEGVE